MTAVSPVQLNVRKFTRPEHSRSTRTGLYARMPVVFRWAGVVSRAGYHVHDATEREMSEHTPHSGPAAPELDFEHDELEGFDADDVTAGRALCKMLSLFFLYTVIGMAIAGYWTATSLLD